MNMKKKIFHYMCFLISLSVVCTFILTLTLCYPLFFEHTKQEVKDEAVYLTYVFNHNLSDPLKLLHNAHTQTRITWIDINGNILFDNSAEAAHMENHLLRPEIQSALDIGIGEAYRISTTLGSNTYYYAVKLNDGTILRLSRTNISAYDMLRGSLPILFAMMLAIYVIALLAARRMARTARVHGAALRSMSCRSRLTRWGRWLGQSILYSVALTALVCGIGAAVAGGSWESRPQGFTELSTVAEIQSSGFDDQEVQIKGRLTNYLYKDYYEFTDELGNSIEVELDDDVDWSPVHKDQLIAIYGEVERNLFKISIDAKSYRILEEMPAPAAAAAPAAAPAAAETTEAPASSLESEELPLENSDDAQNVHLLVDEAATGIKLERINYELP